MYLEQIEIDNNINFRNRLIISDEDILKNEENFNKYFSINYSNKFVESILSHIRNVWFRAKFIGFDTFPNRSNPEAPLIFADNHSGMAFPWDAIVFISKMFENLKNSNNNIRTLISPLLTKFPYMCPFMIDDLWWKAGCINANLLNFETGMKLNQTHLLIFPEGLEGIGKGFDKKYKLQPFKTSFLRMSIRYKTDVIPFYTINAEYNNPIAYNLKHLTKKCRKFGMPFFPMGPIIFLAIFQPWIFYVALPSQINFVIGKPIKVYEMIDKPLEELTQKDLKKVAEKVRSIMQENLLELQQQYSKHPYDIKGLLKAMWKNKRYFFRYFPAFWPLTMTYFDVNFTEKDNNDNNGLKFSFFKCLKTIYKRPIVLAMYLPVLGWLFIGIRSWRLLKRNKQNNS
mgnify:CR=1 FL=1